MDMALEVAIYDPVRRGKRQSEFPEVDIWLVHCTTETTGKRNKIWAKGGFDSPAAKELHGKLGIELDEAAANNGGGFVKGQAYMGTTTLHTVPVNDRPRFLFRVTHEGTPDGRVEPMPFGGLKARGYGRIRTDPLHFQDLVQRHLNWNSRVESPFISVAWGVNLVLLICESYIHKRCQGIRIHRIDTSGAAWNHQRPVMFSVQHLAERFSLRMRDAFETECLVEDEIPTAAIVETIDCGDFPMSWIAIMRGISLALHSRRERRAFKKLKRLQKRIRKVRELAHQLRKELAQEPMEGHRRKNNDQCQIVEGARDQNPNPNETLEDAIEEDDPECHESENRGKPENGDNTEDVTMVEDVASLEDAAKPTQDGTVTKDTESPETARPSNEMGSSGNIESPGKADSSEDEDDDKEKEKKALRLRCKGFQRVNWKKKA